MHSDEEKKEEVKQGEKSKDGKVDLKREFSREILLVELQKRLKEVKDSELLLQNHLQQLDRKRGELVAQLNATLGKQQNIEDLIKDFTPEPILEPEIEKIPTMIAPPPVPKEDTLGIVKHPPEKPKPSPVRMIPENDNKLIELKAVEVPLKEPTDGK
jgi:hypothetical protein